MTIENVLEGKAKRPLIRGMVHIHSNKEVGTYLLLLTDTLLTMTNYLTKFEAGANLLNVLHMDSTHFPLI